jgi:ketosteroid isomerase-like protein
MSQENIEIVRAAYEVAFAQRNVEGVLDRFAEDFTWQQRADFPGRTSYGPMEMPQLWAELDDTYSELNMVPVEFIDAGDYVIVTVETSARLRGSDARIETLIWHVWRMRDGLAAEGAAYGTRREASEAAGMPE